MDTDVLNTPEEETLRAQLMATMRGESKATQELLKQGEKGLRAMLHARSCGPYPDDLHAIDAARRLSEILQQVVQENPNLLFRLIQDTCDALLDAECSDLVRLFQEVTPQHEDEAVDVALSVLGHENPYVRYHGVRILLKFPRECSRDALLRQLRDRSLMVRRRVIHGMTENGFFRTPEVRVALETLLASGTSLQRGSLLWAEMKTLQQLIQSERPAALS